MKLPLRSADYRTAGLIILGFVFSLISGWMVVHQSNWWIAIVPAAGLAAIIFVRPFFGLLILVALLPLESAFLSISGGAVTATRLLGIYIFGAWIAQLIVRRRKVKLPPVAWWSAVFVLWAMLSFLWAWNKGAALEKMQTVVQLVLFALLVIDLVNSRWRLGAIMIALFSGCFIVTILGLLRIGIKPESLLLTLQEQGAKEFGSYVGIVFLLGTILFVFNTKWHRILGLGAAVISGITLLYIGERGVFLAIGLAWVILALISRYNKIRTIAIIVIFLAFLYFAPPFLAQRGLLNANIAERLTINSVIETGGGGRVDIWKVGLDMISNNLLVGVGLSNFPYAFWYYAGTVNPSAGLAAHSDLMSIASELGLIGLLIFLGLLISISKRLVDAFRHHPDLWRNMLAITVFSLFVYALSIGLTSTYLWRKIYWLILAMVMLIPDLPVAEMHEE
jgi:O-antigen ligase